MPTVDEVLADFERCATAAAEREAVAMLAAAHPEPLPKSPDDAQRAYADCVSKRADCRPYSGEVLNAALRLLSLDYRDFCEDASALKAKRMRRTMTTPADLADVTRQEIEQLNQRFPRVAAME